MQKRAGDNSGEILEASYAPLMRVASERQAPAQDVRFRSADIRVVEHRCHLPARLCILNPVFTRHETQPT
jgi:hypothetical protein